MINDMEKGLHTGIFLNDLQKAFDALKDHNILLKNMDCNGLKKVTKWFK